MVEEFEQELEEGAENKTLFLRYLIFLLFKLLDSNITAKNFGNESIPPAG